MLHFRTVEGQIPVRTAGSLPHDEFRMDVLLFRHGVAKIQFQNRTPAEPLFTTVV